MRPPGLHGETTTGIDFVEEYVTVADRLATAVASRDLSAPVPSCPGWTEYDLVCHLGNVHAWAATIVETGRFAVEQNDEPGSHKPRVVSDWYAAKAEDLLAVLRLVDPARPTWNFAFGESGKAAFWRRRQLHETLIHGVDLGLPVGSPVLAADGVDEVLTVFLHRMHHRGRPAALTAPLSLYAADLERGWTLTPRPVPPSGAPGASRPPSYAGPPLVVERLHPAADRITAPADVLYRLLWKRVAADDPTITRTGDLTRLDAFLASPLTP
ncbi:MAG: maleylpyruvate isomerase family mycothiol-dependent enzyme [Nocardioidaceae bacterium]